VLVTDVNETTIRQWDRDRDRDQRVWDRDRDRDQCTA